MTQIYHHFSLGWSQRYVIKRSLLRDRHLPTQLPHYTPTCNITDQYSAIRPDVVPVNTKHLYNSCTMLVQSRRRWADVSNLTKKHNLVSYFYSNVTIICHSPYTLKMKMKWNESGFRPPLCTYRLNWARRTSWGWWDDWDDTVLQTQDSKFEPWRSEAEHATSRSRKLSTILTFTSRWGRNIFVFCKPPRPGTEPRTLTWKAAVLTTTLGPQPTLKMTDDNSHNKHDEQCA